MEALYEFKSVSGLAPSLPKSTAFFCNVLNHVKVAILNILPFEEGSLPVKYLGVPLVSTRLLYRDCQELVERVRIRISDWKNKFLSFTGRLQLVQSVLSSMHVYWASVFILPSRVVQEIEQLLRGFLWSQGEPLKGKSKVAWEVVCLPKDEGGLGIRRLDIFNVALFSVHIWNIISLKESLWVRWIHTYKLKGKSFWAIPYRGNMSWSWRKLLQIRPLVREFFWFTIGNGEKANVWFDNWCNDSPIYDRLSSRMISNAGFTLSSTVSDVVSNGQFTWPSEWSVRLLHSAVPTLVDRCDKVLWKNIRGEVEDFSVAEVWNTIRPRDVKVDWYSVVWHNRCIPKHAFHLWLILKQKLKTQDKLQSWDMVQSSTAILCPLCGTQPDSHDHLFFDCIYSSQVWSGTCLAGGVNINVSNWISIMSIVIPLSKLKHIDSVVTRLVLAATSYYIWQERNRRLFQQQSRPASRLINAIIDTVRLKLLSFKFKKNKRTDRVLGVWKLPSALVVEGV